ncbi:hypothetical protein D0C36_16000 [Mucilaginibacter conchicola]|uniref:Uncharacterized protein n=1 Tax=Mucilaginibacter conchicola TaxID=2303333 RepID=A0A372NUE5_9SPHI|nr:hypothetical protein D0C36_16000 [Mucilaginibacter conchicola]
MQFCKYGFAFSTRLAAPAYRTMYLTHALHGQILPHMIMPPLNSPHYLKGNEKTGGIIERSV